MVCNRRKVILGGCKLQILILVALLIPIKSEESDECKVGEWRCGDRSCAGVGATCDGALDCEDGSDEGLLLCRGTKRPLLGLLLLCMEPWTPLQAVLCPDACRKWPDYCYNALSAEHGEPGTCIFPPFPSLGDYSITDIVPRGVGPADFSLVYSCPAGYRLLGKNPRCIEGVWSGRFPSCIPASYSAVSSDGGGKHSCSVLQFPCENGACVRWEQRCDGAMDCADASDELCWDEPLSTYKMCVLPEYPEHGSYTVMDYPLAAPGQVYASAALAVSCNHGHEVMGSNSIFCSHGLWSDKKMPQCGQCGTVLTTGRQLRELSTYNNYARRGEIPWHAGIYRKTRPYEQICGGSLVSTSVVISAAHCLWNEATNSPYAPNIYAVALGKIYRAWTDPGDPDAHKSDVKSIAIPDRFRGSVTNYQEDISLVVLSTPVKYSSFIQPVCIDFSRDLERVQLDTSLGKVAGWGLTSEDGPPSQVLKTKELLHVDLRRCIQDLPADFISMVTGDKICGDPIKGTTICRGDSGGGVAFPTLDGRGIQRYYLRGVVSTAPANEHRCNVESHILLTRVSDHEIFISQKYP